MSASDQSLFDGTSTDIDRDEAPNLYSLQASRQLGIPGWSWYRVEAIAGGVLLTGAVCTAMYTNGPRKGTPNWDKRDKTTDRRVVLSTAHMEAFKFEWERETGRCHHCGGSGQAWCGWSVSGGNRYHKCDRCDGSGKAACPR